MRKEREQKRLYKQKRQNIEQQRLYMASSSSRDFLYKVHQARVGWTLDTNFVLLSSILSLTFSSFINHSSVEKTGP